jgi:hypothetical protein
MGIMTDASLNAMRLHSSEAFQIWLVSELEVREELYAMMGADPGLDEASLDAVEAFLLARYASPDDALRLDQRNVLDAAARHIGLVMVLNIDGAEWQIDLDNKDSVYYRLPIIRFSDGVEECPLSMATAALDRRTSEFLRTVVTSYQEDYNTEANEE